VCRIILLNFEPDGTKISINKHAIQLEINTPLQSIVRWYNSESRGDLCILFSIVRRFLELYLIPCSKVALNDKINVIDISENIVKLAKYFVLALKKLQKIYDYDNAVFALQYYINLLHSGLKGESITDLLPEHLSVEEESLLDTKNIQQLWDNKKIVAISDMIELCFNSKEELRSSYHIAIISMLDKNDEKFRSIIENTTS
jgi:hypothetical protein